MPDEPRNSAADARTDEGPRRRGRPFQRGNPGKRKGTRNRATMAVEAILDGEADALTRKAIALALAGDTTALRLCLERIAPPRRDRPIELALPALKDAAAVGAAMAATAAAMARGEITPSEAATVASVLDVKRRALELVELEQRVAALERQGKGPAV
jgi:hypothetical protein